MTQAIRPAAFLAALALVLAGLGRAPTPVAATTPGSWSDFNQDGWSDLAVGMAYANIQGEVDSGAVVVLYGGADGLTSTDSQIWNADSVLPAGDDVEPEARFGQSLAAGDFDKDGYGDLAIAAPFKDDGGTPDKGKVYVLFGSPDGLTATRTQTWLPTGVGLADGRAGWSMVALDWFDFEGDNDVGDGYADLAIGSPNAAGVGRISIVAGQRFAQLPNGIQTTFDGQHGNSWFGYALAAGDFNDTYPGRGAGLDDLAVGAPAALVSKRYAAGEVVVLQRGSNGLVQRKYYDQDKGTIPDTAEQHDYFGMSLAAGDLDGDGMDELAVGAKNEDLFVSVNQNVMDAGTVIVLPSDPAGTGLQTKGRQFRQGTVGIGGYPHERDEFGRSLVIADFGGQSTRKDLAIGIAGERTGGHVYAGAVVVVDNDGDGLDVGSSVTWSQASMGIVGAPEPEDFFGSALTAGQYGHAGRRDLVVAASCEGVEPAAGGAEVSCAGQVHVLYGQTGGLSATDSQIWSVDSPGVPRNLLADEAFGAALR